MRYHFAQYLFSTNTALQVCRWKSYSAPAKTVLMTNVQDSVFQLFQRVENKHGWMLVGCKQQVYLILMSIDSVHKVSHALAYVTASKNGVSEPEIEDFISLDDKVGENIIPSQMEVAPLHCTVDITQKRRLFKNTKEIEKM